MVCLLHIQVHGTARGGDCDELRLLSNETTILNLRAHGGSLSFLGTKVRHYPAMHDQTVAERYFTPKQSNRFCRVVSTKAQQLQEK